MTSEELHAELSGARVVNGPTMVGPWVPVDPLDLSSPMVGTVPVAEQIVDLAVRLVDAGAHRFSPSDLTAAADCEAYDQVAATADRIATVLDLAQRRKSTIPAPSPAPAPRTSTSRRSTMPSAPAWQTDPEYSRNQPDPGGYDYRGAHRELTQQGVDPDLIALARPLLEHSSAAVNDRAMTSLRGAGRYGDGQRIHTSREVQADLVRLSQQHRVPLGRTAYMSDDAFDAAADAQGFAGTPKASDVPYVAPDMAGTSHAALGNQEGW